MARRRQHEDEEEEAEEASGSEESEEESGESASDASSNSGNEEHDEEDEEEGEEDDGEPKYKLVEADLVEIRKMMEEMDKIKMRLQFRLAREQADSTTSGSSRRRSSVEDIYVPPTLSAAVQTTWDMTHMCEVEKVIVTGGTKPMSSEHEQQTQPVIPVSKSAQLSLQDLARSYGVQDAFSVADSSHRPPSPTRVSPAAAPQMTANAGRTAVSTTTKPGSNPNLWDGLEMHSQVSTLPEVTRASIDKPLKLEASQLVSEPGLSLNAPLPARYSFVDSIGSPMSPTSDTSQVASSNRTQDDESKTIEQKEMEAVRGLLFF